MPIRSSIRNHKCLLDVVLASLLVSSTGAWVVPSIDSTGRARSHSVAIAAVKNPKSTKRSNTISNLLDWADKVEIKLGGVTVSDSELGGLGIVSQRQLPSNSLVLTVPSAVALTVESPGDGPDDSGVAKVVDRKVLADLPWFAQFAVYLYKLDRVSPLKNDRVNMRPWLDSLPRDLDTPIHWDESQRTELQYDFLSSSIARQERQWRRHHQTVAASGCAMTWPEFCWGCECARSRAFSGAYTGGAFRPANYAFTLLLVLVYVGAGLGSLEQAANGAGLVFCAQVLKDFVLPKLFQKKRFVISPIMDMANHKSLGTTAEVSFEFFGDAYSLVIANGVAVPAQRELSISYGARSNDQLLQFYGFVEPNNPHDVYIMPPLREWNIGALEEACGRTFVGGRLEKLERAGLLGGATTPAVDGDEAVNSGGGVVLSRATGLDPAILQALRALVSNDAEWTAAGEAIGSFVAENSGGPENERMARLAARSAVQQELSAKPTTIDQDEALLKRMNQVESEDTNDAAKLAVMFRIEKKKLLAETVQKLI